jgi:superfamily II DNA or RNA helicase
VDVILRVELEIATGRRRILLVAATGAGKTVIAGAIIAQDVAQGRRVLFLAHRRELIRQASTKLYDIGVDHGIVQAGFPTRPGAKVQVASIPTLHRRAVQSTAMDLPPADLVVVDEAHHVRARSYLQILDAYRGAVILGLTATPCRGDGRGLGNVFEVIVECPPVKVYAPTRPDLRGVQVARGDYVEKQLAQRMDTGHLIGDIVTHWLRLAEQRRTVVFATGVAHSVHLRDEFRRAGVVAEHIDAKTPTEERDTTLAKLAAGTVEVVTNAMVLAEGWDCPEAACLILARPTRHHGLYRQMVGRVLRPASGKIDALILDHAGAVFEHGFIDERVIWTLDQDKRAESPAQALQAQHRAPALTTCPECTAVRRRGAPCPACGWRPQPKPHAVAVADGELGQVDRQRRVRGQAATPGEMLACYRGLLWMARERGYKPGWAAHKHKERYGYWPVVRFADPAPPDQALRSWVRSRQIAYAKAIARRAS